MKVCVTIWKEEREQRKEKRGKRKEERGKRKEERGKRKRKNVSPGVSSSSSSLLSRTSGFKIHFFDSKVTTVGGDEEGITRVVWSLR